MTLKDLTDVIIRDISGAKNTTGNKFDGQYIAKTIHSYRARLCEIDFKRTGFVAPIYRQDYYLQFDKNFQGSVPQGNKIILYTLPRVITLVNRDGIEYIGGISCSSPWRYLRNRQEMATLNGNWFTSISNHPKTIYALYDAAKTRLELYNAENVREGLVQAVFADPCSVPTYNPDVDPYPIDEGNISELRDLILKGVTETDKAIKAEMDFNTPQNTIALPPRPTTNVKSNE
jgi:hypothetical protein